MAEPTKLLVIWSSGDREVALYNALMYAHNAKRKGWWSEVRLLVWGPSAALLVQDAQLQAKVKAMMDDGVHVLACKACADHYDASEPLAAQGIEVFYVGEALTDMLKEGWVTLTY
jgi:hypothetical protein